MRTSNKVPSYEDLFLVPNQSQTPPSFSAEVANVICKNLWKFSHYRKIANSFLITFFQWSKHHNTQASPSKYLFTCSTVKNFSPMRSTLENVSLLVEQLMLTLKDNIQSIPKITFMWDKGKQTKFNSKSTFPKLTRHLTHTKEVVTEPLVGVSMTIPLNIKDIARFKLLAQLSEIKECVAPVSIMAINGVLFIKPIPRIKLFGCSTSSVFNAKTFPQAFFGLVH